MIINTRILDQNDTIITNDLLFETIEQLTVLFLTKGLMVPFLLNSETWRGYMG